MKKRLLAGGLALILSLGCISMVSAGIQGDSLVSLSYLTGPYRNGLTPIIQKRVEKAAKPIYDTAVAKVTGGSAGSGQSTAGGLNDKVTLNLGASLVWTAGSGQVSDGTLVDVSTGSEVGIGRELTVSNRYLAAARTVVTVTSKNAQWMAEGTWSSTAILPFTDVPVNSWYYGAVRHVVAQNLFNGTSATQFSPLMSMDRRMMTTVLHRMAGSPPVEYSPIFSDVPDDQWYTDGIVWAGQAGVVSGTGDGTFLPALNVARQQIAVILYQYAKYAGYDTSAADNLSQFTDSASAAFWAKDAMSWAVAVGILQGSGGRVMPEKSATRAEVATMLQRFQSWAETQ